MIDFYPNAKQVPAHPSNYHAAGRDRYIYIVPHCTDGHADPMGTAEMWQQPNHKSTAHFVIGQDGTVIQAVKLSDVAWHAHSANATSVGIEHCARTPKTFSSSDPGMPPTEEQYDASAKLVAWLCHQMGLIPDRDTIQGHCEIDDETTHTECPQGCGWNWLDFMAKVTDEYAKTSG